MKNLQIHWSNLNILLILLFNYIHIYYNLSDISLTYHNISIAILFMYLFFDTLMMFYYPASKNITFIMHHIIGMLSIILSSQYNIVFLFSRYINFEISTIFLNYYYIKKNYISKILFFISFTIIRMIYGTFLLFETINFDPRLWIIVIPFHAINYYWYYGIIKKLLS